MGNVITKQWGAVKNVDNPICDIIKEYNLVGEGFRFFDKYKYSNFYCVLFATIRERVKSVLEIGVETGGSLFLWSKYFPNIEKVIGIDISAKFLQDNIFNLEVMGDSNDDYIRYKSSWDGVVEIFIMDAYDDKALNIIRDRFHDFDIIIDDGPHTVESWKYFMDNYTSLTSEGLLIIEDISQLLLEELSGYNNDYIAYGGGACANYKRHKILPRELEFETKDCLLINDKRRNKNV